MKDLIKELAIKAGMNAPTGSDTIGLLNFDYREFAQLIVKECANVVAANADADRPWIMTPDDIMYHFGLGETYYEP